MEVFIKAERVSLEVPLYLQHEREARNWRALFLGAAFDPPNGALPAFSTTSALISARATAWH
jgi:hypothetical protein